MTVLSRLLRPMLRPMLVPLLAGLLLVAPAAVSPRATTPAQAAVYDCGCPSSAYDMLARWDALNFPSGAAWRQIGTSRWLYGGAVHQNRERQLPIAGRYREYDAQVYTSRGQSRGAKRIVIDIYSYAAWYSPNHYTDFYRM
jgi:guanyl-specific ribonuclease Sa